MPELDQKLDNLKESDIMVDATAEEGGDSEDKKKSKSDLLGEIYGKEDYNDVIEEGMDKIPQGLNDIQDFNFLHGSCIGYVNTRTALPKLRAISRSVKDEARTTKLKEEQPDIKRTVYVGDTDDNQKTIDELYNYLLNGNEAAYLNKIDELDIRGMSSLAKKEYSLDLTEQKPYKPKLAVIEIPQEGFKTLETVWADGFEWSPPEDKTDDEVIESNKVILLDHSEFAEFTLGLFGGQIKESKHCLSEGARPGIYRVRVSNNIEKDEETGEIVSYNQTYKAKHNIRKTLLSATNYLPLKKPRTKKVAELTDKEITQLSTEYLASKYEKNGGEPNWAGNDGDLVDAEQTATGDWKITCKLLQAEHMPKVKPWLVKNAGLDAPMIEDPVVAIKDGSYDYLKLDKDFSMDEFALGKYLLNNEIYPDNLKSKMSSKKSSSKKLEGKRGVISAYMQNKKGNQYGSTFKDKFANIDKSIKNAQVKY